MDNKVLFLITALACIPLINVSHADTWWNSTYSYRINISTIGCNNLPYCATKLNITDSNFLSHINNACTDIAIRNSTENGAVNFYIDYCNKADKVILYVNNTNQTSLKIYYGNAVAPQLNVSGLSIFDLAYDSGDRGNSSWTIKAGNSILQNNTNYIQGNGSLTWRGGGTNGWTGMTQIPITSQDGNYMVVEFGMNYVANGGGYNGLFMTNQNTAYNGLHWEMLSNTTEAYYSGGDKAVGVYTIGVWKNYSYLLNLTGATHYFDWYLNDNKIVTQ